MAQEICKPLQTPFMYEYTYIYVLNVLYVCAHADKCGKGIKEIYLAYFD